MARYHMKKDGTPGVCNAQPGNCPLGGNENHVDASSPEEAQRQFDSKNEQIAKLNESLRHDFDSYNDEEKAVFSNMKEDFVLGEGYYVEIDKLPDSLKNEVYNVIGRDNDDVSDALVIHRDLEYTGSMAINSAEDEDYDKLYQLHKSNIGNETYFSELKNLDDDRASQEYKELYNKVLDEYMDKGFEDFTKVPINGGKGYLLIEGDFSEYGPIPKFSDPHDFEKKFKEVEGNEYEEAKYILTAMHSMGKDNGFKVKEIITYPDGTYAMKFDTDGDLDRSAEVYKWEGKWLSEHPEYDGFYRDLRDSGADTSSFTPGEW